MKNAMIKKIVIVALIAVMVGALTLGLCACNNNTDNTNNPDTQEWYHFDKAVRFDVNKQKTNVMDMDIGPTVIVALFNVAFDNANTYIEFKPDGKMHFQLQTQAGLFGEKFSSLISMLKNFGADLDVGAMLSSIELTGMLESYVEPMFPGFTAKVDVGDLEGALNLISSSLGLNIVGFDYDNTEVQKLLKEIGSTKRLPADLIDRIPDDTVLTLTWDSPYYVWDVTGHDGKTYTAIAIGELGKTGYTQPWCTFDLSTNAEGVQELFFRAEFMMSQLAFKEHIEQAQA
ncbi:MAG: hypothetical protein K2G31_01095 [Clostridia bacterium]|nr:hypothetical protein [Clostridia bacterium]